MTASSNLLPAEFITLAQSVSALGLKTFAAHRDIDPPEWLQPEQRALTDSDVSLFVGLEQPDPSAELPPTTARTEDGPAQSEPQRQSHPTD